MENYQLADGYQIPQLGFGTYKLRGQAGAHAIATALNSGYRLLDTAYNYENEGAVGAGIRQAGIARLELTVVSKLPGRYYHRQDAINALQESLLRSGLDYFDLYLLHWPNPKRDEYVEAWQALIDAKRFGLVRSIGVCNFLPEYLDRLQTETGELPVLNQIELHPYFNQAAQRQADAERGIVTAAWSPLGRGAVLQDPVIQAIANAHHKNAGQVILRWGLQHEILPIPKAASPVRQRGNLAVFDFTLTAAEMAQIDGLTRADGRLKGQDPATYEEF
ncbi:MAG: aldo/keto reductase [Lactobacillus sp.]|jgi:diketogulonate reductase-like aldo/keto reductase|nr:aldo/keto reductase [Lactobacillus sp.]MCI2033885.1 aldo/keto reductase [Lactobacillus sp.]